MEVKCRYFSDKQKPGEFICNRLTLEELLVFSDIKGMISVRSLEIQEENREDNCFC